MTSRAQQMEKVRPGDILIVIHDFKARSSDELSLAKGDRIELVERDDDFGDGWFLGRHTQNGSTGLFPEVYTIPGPLHLTARNSLPTSSTTSEAVAPASQDTRQGPSLASQPEESQEDARASVISTSSAPSINGAFRTSTGSTRSMGLALKGQLNNPVMDQTLSVIDEHITDMSTPRHSVAAGRDRRMNDSESEYSARMDNRLSYINGHETDEEEQPGYTEPEVMNWTPERVAEYLEDVGVEPKHCEVFREQEISGDVLLGMDQSSIFLKEFDLGSVGRRLKTWHKIKALQQEVTQPRQTLAAPSINTQRSASDYGTADDSVDGDRPRSISSTVLPRIPTVNEDSPSPRGHLFPQSAHGPPSGAFGRAEHSRRPSAASIRNMNHNRRHSSIDYASGGASMPGTPTLKTNFGGYPSIAHKKQGSFDRTWTMNSQQTQSSAALTPRSATGSGPLHTGLGDGRELDMTIVTAAELDRGYFSGGEVDTRRNRNVLRKRDSPSHSRVSSFQSQAGKATRNRSESARHDRAGSMGDSYLDSLVTASQTARNYLASKSTKNGTDISKPMAPVRDVISPTVTKLEYGDSPSIDSIAAPSPMMESDTSSLDRTTPSPTTFRSNLSRIRATGLRAISDAVTGSEKALATNPSDRIPSPIKETQSSLRARAVSPSRGARVDFDESIASKVSTDSSTGAAPVPFPKPRRKSKKDTSAYSRGLEKKSPAEQMVGCDFSGWMKKRSSNLMTTWKPRFFVLRGRRLSYYYSEDDTEEKGLIDISFHRVLPANNERLTGLHATLTGATQSPTSPNHSHSPSIDASEAASSTGTPASNSTSAISALAAATVTPPSSRDPTGTFIFKLVPPRAGLSKAVNFTKPTVHYFAVDNLATGRLWMAALMKATIDRDESSAVVTTYKESTISLAKARAMRQRPPALRDLEEGAEDGAETVPQIGSEVLPQSRGGTSIDSEGAKSKVDSGAGLGIGTSPSTPGTTGTDDKGSATTDATGVGRKSG